MIEGYDRLQYHQIPRHPRERRRTGPGQGPYVQGSDPQRTYYIIPPGMKVIFRDEFGNELER